MRRLGLCFLLLLCPPLQAQEFTLQQVSDQFPSRGFENEIEFWRSMFGRYGETQVVFHDRRDLRLIYEVVHFDRGIAGDPEEEQRQEKILVEHKEKLQLQLQQLAAGLPESQFTEEQAGIVRTLRRLGYQPDSALYREMRGLLRFQRGLRQEFLASIVRSGRYLGHIEEMFQQHGLPPELAVLPHIESSFRHEARSKAGAAGLWQFVRSTGRAYLTINSRVDERYDPLESTRAAALLLKSNHRSLGTWPLAITAYNYGANGMKRAKRQHGEDLVKIVRDFRSPAFGFASRNFYPEFLAALEVVYNRRAYFGDVELEPLVVFDTLRLPRSTSVRQVTSVEGIELARLKELNPSLRSRVWRAGTIPAGYGLRLPTGSAAQLAGLLEAAGPGPGEEIRVAEDGSQLYRVQRGDNLATIAARFGVSVGQLGRANAVSNRNLIYPGQVLAIPAGGSSGVQQVSYRVRRGDNLASIASRFGVSSSQIARANSLSNRNLIHPGQVLTIPTAKAVAEPTRYRVRRGDTLELIARRFRTTIRALMEINDLANANRIFLGQVLLIP